jgi:hypothetical protein
MRPIMVDDQRTQAHACAIDLFDCSVLPPASGLPPHQRTTCALPSGQSGCVGHLRLAKAVVLRKLPVPQKIPNWLKYTAIVFANWQMLQEDVEIRVGPFVRCRTAATENFFW